MFKFPMSVPPLLVTTGLMILVVVVSVSASSPSSANCDFDSLGFCQWTNAGNHDYQWIRAQDNKVPYSGPPGDHTKKGKGYYVVTKVVPPANGAVTNMTSPAVNLTSEGLCFSLWYMMRGKDSGTLSIYSIVDDDAQVLSWLRVGVQGDDWMFGSVHIPQPEGQSGTKVKVVVEARMKGQYMARYDIAVDDVSFTTGDCEPLERAGYCPFESVDLCGYSVDSEATFPWTWLSPDPGQPLGPASDHSLRTQEGHFMITDSMNRSKGDTARLTSPFVSKTDAFGMCLQFYFYMFGVNMGTLNVYTRDRTGNLHGPVWSRSGDLLDTWQGAHVTIVNSKASFQVVFEGIMGGGGSSNMAVDDVRMLPHSCASPATCDFEEDSCLFRSESPPDSLDWMDWVRIQGTKWTNDHTLADGTGHMMQIRNNYKDKHVKRARLISELLPPTNASCLSFFYQVSDLEIYGGRDLTVALDKIHGKTMHLSPLWSANVKRYIWTKAQIEFHSSLPYSLVFEANLSNDFGLARLDDIVLEGGPCNSTVNFTCIKNIYYKIFESIPITQACDFITQCKNGLDEALCGSCDFSNGPCGLHDISRGSFSWQTGSDITSASDTTPRIGTDHTDKSSLYGHFIYVHWDEGTNQSPAILNTPTIQFSFETCIFEFFYKRSDDGNNLAVYVEMESRIVEVWRSFATSSGNNWIHAQAHIGRIASQFQVSIRASSLSLSKHSIAIDDTKFLNCGKPNPSLKGCSSDQFTCANEVCIDPIYKCDLSDDCGDYSDEMDASCNQSLQCTFDFEDSVCDWTQSSNDDLDWVSNAGAATQSNSVPRRDHTTNTDAGTYLYLKSTVTTKPGQAARLLSPVLEPTSAQNSNCSLTLYYHMLGKSKGSLNVYTATEGDSYRKLVYTRQHFSQDFWVRDVVSLVATSYFRVVIEGIVSLSTDDGDTAIDDITLSAGCKKAKGRELLPLPKHPETTVAPLVWCPNSQFRCDDGNCIDESNRCDFTPECADASDEKYCGPCNFESGLCGWSHISTGRFKWSLTNSSSQSLGRVGPSVDADTKTSTGHYVYVEKADGITSDPAVFVSPRLGSTSEECVMSFDYNVDRAIGIISVGINTFGVSTHLWSSTTSASSSNTWTKAIVNFGEMTGPLTGGSRLEISFVGNAKPKPSVATSKIGSLDNLLLSECAPRSSFPRIGCNFDVNMCNWRRSIKGEGEHDFVLKDGTREVPARGGQGRFVSVRLDSYTMDHNTTLETFPLPPTPSTGVCFSFWYYITAGITGTLQLHSRNINDNTQQLLWSETELQESSWLEMNVYLNQTSNYKLVFTATDWTWHFSRFIALDDFSVITGECPPSIRCTFENGLCEWTQNTGDGLMSWKIGQKEHWPFLIVPYMGHTLDFTSSHYAYISSEKNRQGLKAVLTSKNYTASKFAQGGCFTFWYLMTNKTIGELHVYMKNVNGQRSELWYLNESLSIHLWKRASFRIPSTDIDFQIQVEAILGSGEGFISIDDLFVNNDDFCATAGSCTFDDNLCGFVAMVIRDNPYWILHQGQNGTGPYTDHTTGTIQGKYVDIKVDGSRVEDNATLVSDVLQPTSNSCLSFWYHIHGENIGSLHVNSHTSSSEDIRLWSMEGYQQGNQWLQAKIDYQSSVPFEFRFIAVSRGGNQGDFAIDDVFYDKDHRCDYVPPTGIVSKTTSPPPVQKPSPLDCDFESEPFPWNDGPFSGRHGWVLINGSNVFRGDHKPPFDHTLNNAFGHYVYSYQTSHSRLVSLPVTVPAKGVCLKFWYYMYGSSLPDLSVYVKSKERTDVSIWKKHGNQGPEWRYAQIHIDEDDVEENTVITFDVKGRAISIIALDDISMTYGDCPRRQICDFEDGFCDYIQAVTDDFDWRLNSPGMAATISTGPAFDHTYETAEGHYAYVDAYSRKPGEKAQMKTYSHSPTSMSSCLSFWYNMNGESMGALNIWLEKDGAGQGDNAIWTKSGNQGVDWHMAYVKISSAFKFKMIFEAIIGSGKFSNMAVDDIKLSQGSCPELGTCDFEKDACSWRNANQGDDYDWVRDNGYREDGGKLTDHTLNSQFGRFMIFTLGHRRIGSKAKFVSPPLDKLKSWCLNVWYKLDTYQSKLYVKSQDLISKTEGSTLFQTSKRIKTWTLLRLTVGPFPKDFNIAIFGAVIRRGYDSIAIDDLAIQEGSCESLPSPLATKNVYQCPEGRFLSRRELCDFQSDCAEGEEETSCGYNCNFENGTCKWSEATRSSYIWTLSQGVDRKGPSVDETLNTESGHYYTIEKRRNIRGSWGAFPTLKSPLLQSSSPTCEFLVALVYSKVSGIGGGKFKIIKHTGWETMPLFENSKNQYGPAWKTLIIALGESKVPFSLSIQAQLGRDVKGHIAVDDLRFRNCQYPQPGSSCTTTHTFKCKNGACVHPSLVCNFKDDCGDGSDETNSTCLSYTRCSFEIGDTCVWTQEALDDDFEWLRGSRPPSNDYRSGPAVDHTTSLPSGYYLSMDRKRSNALHGDKAWFLSPVLGPTTTTTTTNNNNTTTPTTTTNNNDTHCFLNLYLLMHGENIDTFTVYTRTETNGVLTRVYSASGEGGLFWRHVSIDVESASNFQFVLEGIHGKGISDSTAIDDIVLSPGCKVISESLPTVTPIPSTTMKPPCGDTYKWQCTDKSQCIYKTEVCDFVNQCDDKSDEKNCGVCDFQTSSLCGWKDQSKGEFIWQQANTSTSKPQNSRNAQDMNTYMQVISKGYGYHRPAILVSPFFGSTEAGCSITFYTENKKSSSNLVLDIVYQVTHSFETYSQNNTILWSNGNRYYYRPNGWMKQVVSIGSRPAGFFLVFRCQEDSPTWPAIDNISFSESCGKTKTTSCSSGEFICPSSLECKPVSAKCDLAKDCQNGEDENKNDCAGYDRCSFDYGTCRFVQDSSDDFDWRLYQPRHSNLAGAPDRDHTLGTENGYFMYIYKATTTTKDNGVARMKGPVMYGNEHGFCYMRLFYHLNGNYTNAINIYTETKEGGNLTLKMSVSKSTDEGDEWKKLVVQLTERTTFRVVIEAFRDSSYRGDIGVDDISFTPHCVRATREVTLAPVAMVTLSPGNFCKRGLEFQCDRNKLCLPLKKWCDFAVDCKDGLDEKNCPSKCDFENGVCGWTNNHKHGIHFVAMQASNDTEPKGHNPGTEKGHFLGFKKTKSEYYFQNPTLLFMSPLFTSSSPTCSFSFWYHGQVDYSTSLSIVLRTAGYDEVLWQDLTSRAHNSSWTYAHIALPPCVSEFQIGIEIRVNPRQLGAFGFDDLAFNGCALNTTSSRVCKDGEFLCANGLCVADDKVCDLSNDCCDGSDEDSAMCYYHRKSMFESDMDGWKVGGESAGWSRFQGKKYHGINRPQKDHTTRSHFGYYLSQECNRDARTRSIATFEMPAPNRECVVVFWYQYYGDTTGSISVRVRAARSGELSTIASMISNTTNAWIRGHVSIDLNEKYELMIEGNCITGAHASNNIDDVVFSPSCNVKPIRPPPPKKNVPESTTSTTTPTQTTFTPCPSSDQFQCHADGVCISNSKVCDFTIDCEDKSDESVCHTTTTCEFTENLCSWSEDVLDFFDWTRSTSSDPGPSSNAYIHNSIEVGGITNRIASLKSKTFSSSAAGCVIEFDYFLDGRNPGTLSLEITSTTTTTTTTHNTSAILWEARRVEKKWRKATVGIGRRTSPFVLAFTKAPAQTYTGHIALDVIKFSPACKQLPSQRTCDATKKTYRCANGACIPRYNTCDKQDDCGDWSDETRDLCKDYTTNDFESKPALGNLGQRSQSNLRWLVWKNNSSSPSSIPDGLQGVDHTTGLETGQYLYVKGSPTTDGGDFIWLLSPSFMALGRSLGCEVKFYAIVPSRAQSVEVGYRTHLFASPSAYNGVDAPPGTYWQFVTFTFYRIDQPFQVVIKASPGGQEGAVAIDDVTFGPHCRPYNKDLPGCSTNQFQCDADSVCIDANKVCNDNFDCSDHTDERFCNCDDSYCHGHGKCVVGADHGIRSCKCSYGHTGRWCETNLATTPLPITTATTTTTTVTTTTPTTTSTTTKKPTQAATTPPPPPTTSPTKAAAAASATTTMKTTDTTATAASAATATTIGDGAKSLSTPSVGATSGTQEQQGSSDTDAWRTPVAVVLGTIAALSFVAVVLIYLYRTKRIGPYGTQREIRRSDNGEGYTNPMYEQNTEFAMKEVTSQDFTDPSEDYAELDDAAISYK